VVYKPIYPRMLRMVRVLPYTLEDTILADEAKTHSAVASWSPSYEATIYMVAMHLWHNLGSVVPVGDVLQIEGCAILRTTGPIGELIIGDAVTSLSGMRASGAAGQESALGGGTTAANVIYGNLTTPLLTLSKDDSIVLDLYHHNDAGYTVTSRLCFIANIYFTGW